MGVTHTKVSAKSDGGDSTLVLPSDWNASHTFDGQLAFPATDNPSAGANVLDDYEEGSWTPVLTFSTPGNLSVVYSAQVGAYTKIGNLVFVRLNLQTSTFTHTTASGNLLITGLPFAIGLSSAGNVYMEGWTLASISNIALRAAAGVSQLNFRGSRSGASVIDFDATHMPSGGTVIISGAVTYRV
jgi:hypothetical protein